MPKHVNPFHELYVTETARPEEFVKLFSDLLVPHALLLFQPGNVVLKGTQGSGKSMLLSLLTPQIRCAYAHSGHRFPVPERLSRFISAGINLTRSGILNIGQRPITKDAMEDERLFPLFFADFLNYWIVRDIIMALSMMQKNRDVFPFVDAAGNDDFAALLAQDPCWFGFLDNCASFDGFRRRLDERIKTYRAFHLANIRQLPGEIQQTKTSVGEPISKTIQCLWEARALARDVPLFVRIDQHEVLFRSDDLRPKLGVEYRRVVNKALSTRDPHVSYRIGTRRYAWHDDIFVYGTSTSLEILRDYRIIDIDDLLRRKEDRSTWMFPAFAEDIFRRRLMHAGLHVPGKSALRRVMGRSPAPATLALEYAGTTAAERTLKFEAAWPEEWRQMLRDLFKRDPLSARLAEAWLRQRRATWKDRNAASLLLDKPWDRTYWRKERIKQALFQLAARAAQRPTWSGAEAIVNLCMGGTLAFVSVCQHIWDAFLRSQVGVSEPERHDPLRNGMPDRVQSLGIYSASVYWHEKISEQTGGGDRRRFIDYLGAMFYRDLIEDRAMSYPGHNGFSVANEELDSDEEAAQFLRDAVDYGDLQDAPHTTKHRDARPRTKWYLTPILSPYFRLPESHVKEPRYVDIATVREWLSELHILKPLKTRARQRNVPDPEQHQLPLLPTEGVTE